MTKCKSFKATEASRVGLVACITKTTLQQRCDHATWSRIRSARSACSSGDGRLVMRMHTMMMEQLNQAKFRIVCYRWGVVEQLRQHQQLHRSLSLPRTRMQPLLSTGPSNKLLRSAFNSGAAAWISSTSSGSSSSTPRFRIPAHVAAFSALLLPVVVFTAYYGATEPVVEQALEETLRQKYEAEIALSRSKNQHIGDFFRQQELLAKQQSVSSSSTSSDAFTVPQVKPKRRQVKATKSETDDQQYNENDAPFLNRKKELRSNSKNNGASTPLPFSMATKEQLDQLLQGGKGDKKRLHAVDPRWYGTADGVAERERRQGEAAAVAAAAATPKKRGRKQQAQLSSSIPPAEATSSTTTTTPRENSETRKDPQRTAAILDGDVKSRSLASPSTLPSAITIATVASLAALIGFLAGTNGGRRG